MEFVKEKLIKPATIEEIVEFEKKEKISLPKEYKNFLLKHNNRSSPINSMIIAMGIDNHMIEETIEFFYDLSEGLDYELSKQILFYEDRISKSVIPIANLVGDNQICIRIEGEDKGSILYWDHEYELEYYRFGKKENLAKIANDFNEFILMLLPDPYYEEE